MAELKLAHSESMALRTRAHGLGALVLLGAAGLSEAVVREIDRALSAHELVKVRAGRISGEERDTMFLALADRLGAARIQSIGHTFVLYRPAPVPAVKKTIRQR